MSSGVSTCPACGTKNRVPATASGRPQCASCHGPLPWLVNVDDAEFSAATNTNQIVLVDLWAPWCGPCRMVAPILERLASQYAGKVKVVKVNVDHNPRTSARFDAQSIPTLVILRGGKTVTRLVGAQPEAVLKKRIDALLAS
ncbi:thioredoxin [Propionicimonas paludicola]|uniref:Thioredoxin n=1 Tax=Propionicimonas paludicola TaxID=185243 RepID=A0A2A9CRY3_9ACTN|nr:thioredoxin [Propionicimonas paludicola]PFG17173.1 thioredoxin [Propionicimonas paludicola]